MCQSRGGASRTALFSLVLALSLMNLGIPSAYAAWTDDNPPGASQCAAVDVNDAGTVSNASLAYVELSGSLSQLAPLPSTPGGAPLVRRAGSMMQPWVRKPLWARAVTPTMSVRPLCGSPLRRDRRPSCCPTSAC